MRIRHLLLLTAAIAASACSHSADDGHDHSAEAATEAHDSHEGHNHEGHNHGDAEEHAGHNHEGHNHAAETEPKEAASGEIEMTPEAIKMFGIESEKIEPQRFHDVIAVSGQIVGSPQSSSVVTAPTAGVVRFASGIEAGKEVGAGAVVATVSSTEVSGGNAEASAKAALDAAKAELDRLTPLYEEGLATAKDYYAAKQAYEQAKAAYSPKAASGRATAVTAGVITNLLVQQGQYVDAGTPIAEVSSNKRLTLRADVPARYYQYLPSITTANIEVPYANETLSLKDLGGSRVSGAQANAQNGYTPVYFSFNNNGQLMPGAYVKVQLIGAPRDNAITVPVQAIVEQQGHYFAFRRLDPECFEKVAVKLGASDGQRVEVLSGIKAGDEIVVKGAPAVRLAESATVAPEGHSHNH